MLRPTAPKKPVPLKENMLDLNCWPTSPSSEMYIIPALQMNSAISEITILFDDK
jgi:hypothetical protein